MRGCYASCAATKGEKKRGGQSRPADGSRKIKSARGDDRGSRSIEGARGQEVPARLRSATRQSRSEKSVAGLSLVKKFLAYKTRTHEDRKPFRSPGPRAPAPLYLPQSGAASFCFVIFDGGDGDGDDNGNKRSARLPITVKCAQPREKRALGGADGADGDDGGRGGGGGGGGTWLGGKRVRAIAMQIGLQRT
jgi:hypothetical protein